MHQFAGEENDLILLRNNRLVASITDVRAVLQVRVVNTELAAIEPTWFLMEEVHECEVP